MNRLHAFGIRNDRTSYGKRYGFMVSELTGEVDDLETEHDDKPSHESAGFSYAKWFKTPEERDKTRDYTLDQIKLIQSKRK
jgi:hypothetical protein